MTDKLTKEDKNNLVWMGFALYGAGAVLIVLLALRLGYL